MHTLTDKDAEKLGDALVALLAPAGLRASRPIGHFTLAGGSKTVEGLARTVMRLVLEHAAPTPPSTQELATAADLAEGNANSAAHWAEKAKGYAGRASCKTLHDQAERLAHEYAVKAAALRRYAANI